MDFKYSVILTVAIIAVAVYAISLTDIGKVCLFSRISGIITLDGKPVKNGRLVRTADRDGERTDETITDANGFFEFPSMFERTITKFLPMEFVASQQILLFYHDQQYEIWTGIKRQRAEHSEARGKELTAACELRNEIKSIVVRGSFFHTPCILNVETDPPYNWAEDLFEPDVKSSSSAVVPDDK